MRLLFPVIVLVAASCRPPEETKPTATAPVDSNDLHDPDGLDSPDDLDGHDLDERDEHDQHDLDGHDGHDLGGHDAAPAAAVRRRLRVRRAVRRRHAGLRSVGRGRAGVDRDGRWDRLDAPPGAADGGVDPGLHASPSGRSLSGPSSPTRPSPPSRPTAGWGTRRSGPAPTSPPRRCARSPRARPKRGPRSTASSRVLHDWWNVTGEPGYLTRFAAPRLEPARGARAVRPRRLRDRLRGRAVALQGPHLPGPVPGGRPSATRWPTRRPTIRRSAS